MRTPGFRFPPVDPHDRHLAPRSRYYRSHPSLFFFDPAKFLKASGTEPLDNSFPVVLPWRFTGLLGFGLRGCLLFWRAGLVDRHEGRRKSAPTRQNVERRGREAGGKSGDLRYTGLDEFTPRKTGSTYVGV